MVTAVMQSRMWARARASRRSLVEVPFLVPMRDAGSDQVAPALIRGVIDLVFAEPGGWVIVDYKTDRVETPDQIRERARSYAGQGASYVQALREALGLDADPRFELWFLHPGHIEVVSLAASAAPLRGGARSEA